MCTLLNTLLVTMAATSIDGYLVTVLTHRIVMLLIQQIYRDKKCDYKLELMTFVFLSPSGGG
jgi:hypothetical protein